MSIVSIDAVVDMMVAPADYTVGWLAWVAMTTLWGGWPGWR